MGAHVIQNAQPRLSVVLPTPDMAVGKGFCVSPNLYDVPGGAMRAGHALKTCHQFVIAVSGSFDVVLDDGLHKERYHLNRSHYGLYVAPLIWREIDNFSSGSVCAVLASEFYDEADYFRDYLQFLSAVGGGHIG